jgi:hypothetical protein
MSALATTSSDCADGIGGLTSKRSAAPSEGAPG